MPGDVIGLLGEEIETIVEGDLVALASKFAGDFVPVTRENVFSHDTVVRTLLEKSTPLPFRFGTLVSEERLRNYLKARSQSLHEKLIHVSDCVEMSVKMIWQLKASEVSSSSENFSNPGQSSGAGSRFLIARQREFMGAALLRQHANEIKEWLEVLVMPVVVSGLTTIHPGKKLVLSAAHLVKRSQLESYRETISGARSARPELHFLLSGPWAPYSFSNIDLEFESHFGVS